MGYLYIGPTGFMTQIDDRALAHLKVIILTELRNGRGVALSLRHEPAEGSGRETFWVHPGTDVRFQFLGGRAPRLNHTWLRAMADSCTSGTGLYIMNEPEEQLAPPSPRVEVPER
ncbi:DUF7882 family protein [Herbiconiux daphne]|uniref:DUF7882 domain-containing protein n=1 Tax=Herbiconiux daphne TaxID=2970914 RepID=A0ABT2GWU8_9MICO|nr:hypothetical protein [Herbiconiux daphne]MCS5732437.1 hypothetical protein [Herbiconiux daphne]